MMVVSDIQANNMEDTKNSKEQGPNLFLYHRDTKSVVIISGEAWYMRIWLLLSNPFRYLFTGRVRH